MEILHFPLEILAFWPPILSLTLSSFSAKGARLGNPSFPYGNPCILATHTEPHSKLIFCEFACMRGVRGLEILHLLMKILAFWPPILSLTLSTISAPSRRARGARGRRALDILQFPCGNPCSLATLWLTLGAFSASSRAPAGCAASKSCTSLWKSLHSGHPY